MPPKHANALLKSRIEDLEAAVRQRASEWEHTVNAMSDWICIIDLNFRIVRTNRAVEDILGVPHDTVVGRTCYGLVHGSDMPVAPCPLQPMIKSGQRAQADVQLSDGRWLAVTADPLMDRHGRLEGAVHMVRDITALRNLQAERESLIDKLERSLQEVKTLSGLMPICARCRRIRDQQGTWSPLEVYVCNNFNANVSHGLCPECATQEYEAFDL